MSPRRPSVNEAMRRRSRERLLRATVELVEERGFEETTLGDIADRAGSARGLVSYYFPGKRVLLQAAAHRLMHTELAAALGREPVPADGREVLARAIDAVLALPVHHPVVMRAHMAGILPDGGLQRVRGTPAPGRTAAGGRDGAGFDGPRAGLPHAAGVAHGRGLRAVDPGRGHAAGAAARRPVPAVRPALGTRRSAGRPAARRNAFARDRSAVVGLGLDVELGDPDRRGAVGAPVGDLEDVEALLDVVGVDVAVVVVGATRSRRGSGCRSDGPPLEVADLLGLRGVGEVPDGDAALVPGLDHDVAALAGISDPLWATQFSVSAWCAGSCSSSELGLAGFDDVVDAVGAAGAGRSRRCRWRAPPPPSSSVKTTLVPRSLKVAECQNAKLRCPDPVEDLGRSGSEMSIRMPSPMQAPAASPLPGTR